MSTDKKTNEPLSFSFTEAEIGNACRASIINRLQDVELAKAPFKVTVQPGGVYTDKVGVTVTFWPKRIRTRKANGEKMPVYPAGQQ